MGVSLGMVTARWAVGIAIEEVVIYLGIASESHLLYKQSAYNRYDKSIMRMHTYFRTKNDHCFDCFVPICNVNSLCLAIGLVDSKFRQNVFSTLLLLHFSYK